jgi:glutamine cyclotransferase
MLSKKRITFFLFNAVFFIPILLACSNPAEPTPTPPTDEIQYYTYRVIREYPHQQDAFTQGLVFTEEYLLESTGLYGQSSLRKVELESGTVLEKYNLVNQYFAEGLTLLGNRIYQLTWQSPIGFIYDQETFAVLDTFYYNSEGWGLTHNGIHLIMSDGSSFIRFFTPDSFKEVKKVEVTADGNPVNRLNELEYIQGKIYANIWLTNNIAVINPENGKVTAWIDLSNLLPTNSCPQPTDVLNGIAYDPQTNRLFVTGKWWCRLFEIELVLQ